MRLTLAHDGALWRRLAYAGARYGPDFWVKYSPPLFGVAFALALRPQRQKVRDTLRWVQGETGQLREQRQLFATFIQYACCLTESLAAERPEAANAECRVEGEERLLAALSQGRGALILTAHAGPWDVAARLLRANHGREVVVVMEGEADEDARALHDRVRTRTGVRIVHVGKHPLDALPLVRELKAGTLVAVQLDRGAPSGRGISTQLFDRELLVPEGPFRLAALAGVPIVPLFVERTGYFRYNLVVSPLIELARSAGSKELHAAAQTATDAMAAFIARAPTQWFNF
ncbi:MAG TPA: lysophospholipid acyltransferase family protein [Polyangiaceae bacterium]|nr:lysophospholipid acyltransferase family protein [Polyangiaceae bacterium]